MRVITAANAEGRSESRLYDPRFGVATQLTGPNGLSTTWTLDDFGRKLRETQPDGISTAIAIAWAAPSARPSRASAARASLRR